MFGISRTTAIAFLSTLIAFPALPADTNPPSPKRVTVGVDATTPAAIAKTIKEQRGIDVDVSAIAAKQVSIGPAKLGFWTVLEKLADATDSHMVTTGGRISLKPGKSQAASFISGPFRFVVREVIARGDALTGSSSYTILIDVAWEPWLNVYRVDTTPKIHSLVDHAGDSLTTSAGSARSPTSGFTAILTVRPQRVKRSSKTLTLKGSVMVTIAEKLLTFTFDPMTGKPIGRATQDGVAVKLTKHGREENDWVAVVSLDYPKSDVVWESFEYGWHRNNVMRLLPPKGEPIVADIVEAADFRYGFEGRAKQVGPGWKLDYQTPGPMREIVVPIELKDIRLP